MVPRRLQALLEESAELAEIFRTNGFRLYLVGGAVRDAIANTGEFSTPDLDYTTDARPEDIERITRHWAEALWDQGRQFGTIGLYRKGRRYEITTHRRDIYTDASRKPSVEFASAIEMDLARRDFTVNAMAISLPEPELIDPFGGLADLADKRLRTPGSPESSFDDDPLRMLRAARFLATRGLVPIPEIAAATREMKGRLSKVSPERIRDELDKLIVGEHVGDGLRFLVETDLASVFLPELPALRLTQDPIHRHKDVLAHTIAVVEKTSPNRLLRLAALFHDVGKPATRQIGPDGVSFHNHDLVGARMTRKRMQQLRYPSEDISQVSELVRLHLRFHTYGLGWTDRAVRRYVRDAGPLFSLLNELVRCDCTTRNASRAAALARRMDELELRVEELAAQEELDSIRPDLNGTEVMEILGLAPGPAVGRAMAFLMDLRMDHGPLGAERAKEELLAWWQQCPGDRDPN
jgi:poly(A) polymerase